VRALGVVVRDIERDRKGPLGIGAETRTGVDALALDRADERLRSAVGPGVVRLGTAVADPRGRAGSRERRTEAVVGEDAMNADAAPIEERDRRAQEPKAVGVAHPWTELGVHQPAREVDCNEQMLPADVAAVVVRVMLRPAPAATPLEAAEALDVDRDIPRRHHHEATAGRSVDGEQLTQPRRAEPSQHGVRGRGRQPEVWTEPVRAPPQLQAQPQNRRGHVVMRARGWAVWARAAVLILTPATAPAVCRSTADSELARRSTHADALRLADQMGACARRDPTGAVQLKPLRLVVVGLSTAHPSRGLLFVTQVPGDFS